MTNVSKARNKIRDKRKIKSFKKMKELMTLYYIDAKTAADNNKKVAWITSGGPVELLIAFDVIPVYPENYAAMIGVGKTGSQLCLKAEEMGYSSDLCSYATADIACSVVEGGPINGLPKPDFLICCNNICGTVMKWYEIQSRYYNVPLFIFDTPFIHKDLSKEANEYVRKQIYEYIEFLEFMTGKKFDEQKTSHTIKRAIKATNLWNDVLNTSTNRPAPLSAFDCFIHMALIVTLRGSQEAVDYYELLLKEMKERVSLGIGTVGNEKYRLLWDNLPLWYRLRWLSEKLDSKDAALVASTYTSAWTFDSTLFDENNYIDFLIHSYTNIYINISIDKMVKLLFNMIDKYSIDGIIMHSNRSCKPYSFGQYDLRKMIMDKINVPTLLIEADMLDERNFSEGQIDTRIDAFFELIS
ncbi:2-hydroxyacyl-CoA dehydratase subunit D [Spirochaetota bacterium]